MVEKFEKLNFTEKTEAEIIADSKSFYDNIKKRKSVREFSDRTIPDEVIKNAILAAGSAPNGANLQPWHFVVIKDPAVKKNIRKAAEKEEQEFYDSRASQEWLNALKPFGTDSNKSFLKIAPCLIVVFIKKSFIDESGQSHKTYYPVESVGIATGMLISALHFAGLATLTHTPSPMRFLNNILSRPDAERPFLIVVTGFPEKKAQVPKIRKKTYEEIATII